MYGIDDPSNLLQPWKNIKQFSEELYGMFTRAKPPAAAAKAPDADKPAAPEPAPKVREDPAGIGLGSVRKQRLADAFLARPSASDPGKVAIPGDPRRTQPETDQGSRRAAPVVGPLAPIQGRDAPARRGIDAAPARQQPGLPGNLGDHEAARRQPFSQSGNSEPVPLGPGATFKEHAAPAKTAASAGPEQPPQAPTKKADESKRDEPYKPPIDRSIQDPGRHRQYAENTIKLPLDIGDFARPGGGGSSTTVFMGKVRSGSGDTYQVALYPDGPGGEAGDTVEVFVPTIDPDETIPAGTWISPVFEFSGGTDQFGNQSDASTYSCQPPIWVS